MKTVTIFAFFIFFLILSSNNSVSAGCHVSQTWNDCRMGQSAGCFVLGSSEFEWSNCINGYADGVNNYCDTSQEAKALCGASCPTPPGGCTGGNGPTPGSPATNHCCDDNNVTSTTYNSASGVCSSTCNGQCYYFDQGGTCSWQQTATGTCNPAPPIPVRGYKVPTSDLTVNGQQVTAGGVGSTANPYTISAPGSCVYPVNLNISAVIPPTYSVGYTQCNSSQGSCDVSDTPASPNFYNSAPPGTDGNLWYNSSAGNITAATTITAAGTSATATTNSAPSTVDLWWHYCSSWTNLGSCDSSPSTCGPGVQLQQDSCGNTRTVSCTKTCAFFQTFGGDVTMKGTLSDTQLPSSGYYISGR